VKPSTAGIAASKRRTPIPERSTLKPSHFGSNQNQRLRKANPTESEARVDQDFEDIVLLRAELCALTHAGASESE
jgi:hypothetical protein